MDNKNSKYNLAWLISDFILYYLYLFCSLHLFYCLYLFYCLHLFHCLHIYLIVCINFIVYILLFAFILLFIFILLFAIIFTHLSRVSPSMLSVPAQWVSWARMFVPRSFLYWWARTSALSHSCVFLAPSIAHRCKPPDSCAPGLLVHWLWTARR